MRRIGILYHPLKEAAHALAEKLESFLGAKGLSVWLCSAWEADTARAQAKDSDLVLTVGGDGTILRAAQAVLPGTTPITGINLGNVGFMTELSVDEVMEKLPALLSGEGWADERSLLEVELQIPGKQQSRKCCALNDVVLARGETARVVYVEASIDDIPMTTYKADGVIVATATGSTAYALAAGGPVLYPHVKDMLLLPVSPHLSWQYALVLPSKAKIRLHLRSPQPAALSIDGHMNLTLPNDAIVSVRRSPDTIRFLRIKPESQFYSTLEERLKGKKTIGPSGES
jgi:NAD+ kinase